MKPGRIGQAVTASVETPATAVRIRSATALGCDSAIECDAPAASTIWAPALIDLGLLGA